MSIVEQLAAIEVLDLNGAPYLLGDAWRDQTAVLVFIRHFG